MGEKTRINNDQEDELNQSRFFAERGAEVVETETPGEDGPIIEEEDIMDSKMRFREQPGDPDDAEPDNGDFYAQGFGNGDDSGMQRTPRKTDPNDKASLGA